MRGSVPGCARMCEDVGRRARMGEGVRGDARVYEGVRGWARRCEEGRQCGDARVCEATRLTCVLSTSAVPSRQRIVCEFRLFVYVPKRIRRVRGGAQLVLGANSTCAYTYKQTHAEIPKYRNTCTCVLHSTCYLLVYYAIANYSKHSAAAAHLLFFGFFGQLSSNSSPL